MKEDDNIAIFGIPVIVVLGIYIYALDWLKLLWSLLRVNAENQANVWIDGVEVPFSNIVFLLKNLLVINTLLLICLCVMTPPTPQELYNIILKDESWMENPEGEFRRRNTRATRVSKDFPDWAPVAKKLHVTGKCVSGFYTRDNSFEELVFRLQGGNTLLCANEREWFFIRRGTTKMRYIKEEMEVRLIEEIEMRSTDQPWDIGSALLNDETYCDIRIHFNSGESWLAHRCILETALPLWKENWQKLSTDEEKPKQLTTVEMEDESPKIIREFIKAVYTRNVPKDPDLMIAVCGLASKYHDWSLVSKCSMELVEVLDTYPVYHILVKELVEDLPKVDPSLLRAIERAFESCLSTRLDSVIDRFNESFKVKKPKRRRRTIQLEH